MYVRLRPLPVWPYPETRNRRSSHTFKAPWSRTLSLLERELAFLDGHNVILGAGFQERDLRLDGMPRSDARAPAHPGIELSFDSSHGRLVYATDSCIRWDHNVRAVALGLESLRAVDRYGITRKGEQYAGWRALPSGNGVSSPDEAWGIISTAAGLEDVARREADVQAAVREALKRTHPDRGGDPATFRRVQEARKLLPT